MYRIPLNRDSLCRVIQGVHAVSMAIAIVAFIVVGRTADSVAHERAADIEVFFAIAAVVTGFVAMATRPPRNESLVLAISTLAALILLVTTQLAFLVL
jgi:hypothetical protein